MSALRKKAGRFFKQSTAYIYRRPRRFLLPVIILLLFFITSLINFRPDFTHIDFKNDPPAEIFINVVSGLLQIGIDTSTEHFLKEDDPALKTYNKFRDLFGRDEMVVIAVKPQAVFELDFLNKLKKLHNEIKNKVPHVKEVTSLINARYTRGKEDRLLVEDLMEKWPRTRAEVIALQKKIMANPLYRNMLVSDDAAFTTIVVESLTYSPQAAAGESSAADYDFSSDFSGDNFDSTPARSAKQQDMFLTDSENNEMVSAVKDITRKYNKPDFRIALGGTPVMTDTLKRSMISDMLRFVLLIITAIIVTMGIMFRRREGIMLPMIIVVFSVISTIALMHLLGFTLHLPTMILPSFLLAVGIADAIHILAIFFYRYDHGDSKENAIIYTISHSGLAVLMTSITTAAGLMSFSGSDIAPIAALGLFSGLGVSLAFIYTIIVIPALVSILPIKRKKTAIGRPGHKMDAVLNFFAGFSVKHAGKITVIFMLLLFTSAFFSFRLKFSHDPMMWLPENSDLIKSTRLIDKHLKGASVLEVIIDGGHENSCYNPALLKQIEKTRAKVEAYSNHHISIAKTFTLTDMLKEIHKALNSGSNKYYKIPDKRRIIAQEFLLFENSGSDDLREMVDSGFQQTRFSIKLPWADALLYAAMLKDMEKMFEKDFKDMADTKLTGLVHMLGRTINIAIKGAASSYLIALAVITLLMILLIGKLRIGLLSMFPNLFPIFFSLGLMQLLAIPLDLFTMLIANIAIGLAVDDTIHFMHNWHRYYEEKQDPGAAVRSTLLTAGRAMFTTSVVLIAGFVIFTGGNMRNLQRFGFLSALTISLALLADFLLAPALMTLVHKKISIRSK